MARTRPRVRVSENSVIHHTNMIDPLHGLIIDRKKGFTGKRDVVDLPMPAAA